MLRWRRPSLPLSWTRQRSLNCTLHDAGLITADTSLLSHDYWDLGQQDAHETDVATLHGTPPPTCDAAVRADSSDLSMSRSIVRALTNSDSNSANAISGSSWWRRFGAWDELRTLSSDRRAYALGHDDWLLRRVIADSDGVRYLTDNIDVVLSKRHVSGLQRDSQTFVRTLASSLSTSEWAVLAARILMSESCGGVDMTLAMLECPEHILTRIAMTTENGGCDASAMFANLSESVFATTNDALRVYALIGRACLHAAGRDQSPGQLLNTGDVSGECNGEDNVVVRTVNPTIDNEGHMAHGAVGGSRPGEVTVTSDSSRDSTFRALASTLADGHYFASATQGSNPASLRLTSALVSLRDHGIELVSIESPSEQDGYHAITLSVPSGDTLVVASCPRHTSHARDIAHVICIRPRMMRTGDAPSTSASASSGYHRIGGGTVAATYSQEHLPREKAVIRLWGGTTAVSVVTVDTPRRPEGGLVWLGGHACSRGNAEEREGYGGARYEVVTEASVTLCIGRVAGVWDVVRDGFTCIGGHDHSPAACAKVGTNVAAFVDIGCGGCAVALFDAGMPPVEWMQAVGIEGEYMVQSAEGLFTWSPSGQLLSHAPPAGAHVGRQRDATALRRALLSCGFVECKMGMYVHLLVTTTSHDDDSGTARLPGHGVFLLRDNQLRMGRFVALPCDVRAIRVDFVSDIRGDPSASHSGRGGDVTTTTTRDVASREYKSAQTVLVIEGEVASLQCPRGGPTVPPVVVTRLRMTLRLGFSSGRVELSARVDD